MDKSGNLPKVTQLASKRRNQDPKPALSRTASRAPVPNRSARWAPVAKAREAVSLTWAVQVVTIFPMMSGLGFLGLSWGPATPEHKQLSKANARVFL